LTPANSWDFSGSITAFSSGESDEVWVGLGVAQSPRADGTLWRCKGWGSGQPEWTGIYVASPSSVYGQISLPIRGMWRDASQRVWMVGAGGLVRRLEGWDGDRAVIHPLPTPSLADFNGIWGSSPDDVWVVGNSGAILHFQTAEGRPTWTAVSSGTHSSLFGIWGSGPDDIWAVGENGTIVHWDGTGFHPSDTRIEGARPSNLYAVWGYRKTNFGRWGRMSPCTGSRCHHDVPYPRSLVFHGMDRRGMYPRHG